MGRSTSELKKGRPRKTTPIQKKTLNSSNLPEEGANNHLIVNIQ